MKSVENLTLMPIHKFLIPSKYQTLMDLYMQWWKLLALRGIHEKYHCEKTFHLLYRAVSRNFSEKYLLGKLQQYFIKENLSLSLLLEPLEGFEWLSKNRYPLDLSFSSPILLQIIMPIARFIAVLNNQHPPFYQPFANLLYIYGIMDIKHLPELQKKLKKIDVNFNQDLINQSLPLQYEEAKQVITVTLGFRFKFKIAFYLGLCHILIKKEPKKSSENLNFLDYVNAFLYGLWYFITIRGKTIKARKI